MPKEKTEERKENSKPNSSGTSSEADTGDSLSGSPTSQTPEAQDGQGSGSEEQEIEVKAATGAIDFNHPLLKGKSPEEIERIVEQQERTIRSQNQELNSKFDQSQQARAQPTRQEDDEEDPYGDSFIAPHMRKLEERVSKRLEQAVAPLRDGIQEGRARTVRQKLRDELAHFERLEPHIDQLVREQGVAPAEAQEGLLRTLYYTAVGLAASQGISLDSGQSQAQPTEQPQGQQQGQPQGSQQNVSIPQHRPSSTPMPEQRKQPQHRDLTEEERKMARHYKMSDEEYLEWMNKPVDEVAEPGYSRENW